MAKFNLQKKYKNNLRILSKPHAYFQAMTNTPVSFKRIGKRKKEGKGQGSIWSSTTPDPGY